MSWLCYRMPGRWWGWKVRTDREAREWGGMCDLKWQAEHVGGEGGSGRRGGVVGRRTDMLAGARILPVS